MDTPHNSPQRRNIEGRVNELYPTGSLLDARLEIPERGGGGGGGVKKLELNSPMFLEGFS